MFGITLATIPYGGIIEIQTRKYPYSNATDPYSKIQSPYQDKTNPYSLKQSPFSDINPYSELPR